MTSEIRSKKKQQQPTKTWTGQAQFINHSFTEADKKGYKAWMQSHAEEIWDAVDRLLDSGYRVSLKFDAYNQANACFIQAVSEDSENSGFILTGRSTSSLMALGAALYRHYVLFEERWPTEHENRARVDDD